jgi:two-component sensor histidine kinase
VHTKLLTFINIKVLVFAVVAPVVALGGVSGYIIANQKRLAVEQTVEQSVNTTLYVAERELSKHLAAAEILASMVDLKHLDTYTERINEVMHVRRGEWFNVIVMDETSHLYNYDLEKRGESLIQTVQPDLTRKVLDTGRYDISPVLISDRYPEPFVVIRVPIVHPGLSKITHVLAIVVRAWTFSLAIKSVYTPEHWRVSVLDQNGAIVGRSAAPSSADPFIGKLTPARTVVPDSGLVLVEPTIDNSSLYAVRTMSKLYPGWSAALGVPRDEVDDAIYGIIYTLTAAGVSTIAIACLLCFVLVRAYARQQTTSALKDSLREKETLLREKETLLREVHHRVKNNMQGTVGILLFERSRITDPYAKERLRVISDRISIQGRVHQHLYEQGDLHRIEIGAFLAELCRGIMTSFCQDPCEIELTVETDALDCDIDVAMPLGLITNELMTNAVKHGFKGRDSGEITVTLKRRDDAVVLSVSDTGVGCLDSDECMTETTTQSHGIGTTLIKELVRQIEGEFILMQDITGTTARVRIPLHDFW